MPGKSSCSRRQCHDVVTTDHISYGQLRTHVDAIAQVVNNSHTPRTRVDGAWLPCKRAVVGSIAGSFTAGPQSVRNGAIETYRSQTESTARAGTLNRSNAVLIAKPAGGVVRDEEVVSKVTRTTSWCSLKTTFLRNRYPAAFRPAAVGFTCGASPGLLSVGYVVQLPASRCMGRTCREVRVVVRSPGTCR